LGGRKILQQDAFSYGREPKLSTRNFGMLLLGTWNVLQCGIFASEGSYFITSVLSFEKVSNIVK